jgi:hypothetical protein
MWLLLYSTQQAQGAKRLEISARGPSMLPRLR